LCFGLGNNPEKGSGLGRSSLHDAKKQPIIVISTEITNDGK
jgi:hypothetical protein